MPHYQRLRISLKQILHQHPQRTLLSLSASVLWCLAVGSQSADIAHANTMTVMVLTVSTLHFFRSPLLNRPVSRYDVVIPAPVPSEGTMIPVNVRHADSTPRPVGGAMHNNQRYFPHNFKVLGFEQQLPAIIQQFYQQLKEIFFDNCRYIAGNCCSQKKSLELRHGTASGTRYHQLNDAQYIQRDLLPIHFHTRCF